MSEQIQSNKSFKQALSELGAVRDGIRVQAHLLGMEARERWQELERGVDGVEQRLKREEEKGSLIVLAKIGELTLSLKEFMQRHLPRGSTLEAPVSTIMTPAVRSCAPEDALTVPAQIMWEADCGAVPVVNAEGNALGLITDRDICIAAYTQGNALSVCSVASAMSKQVFSCHADAPISHALQIMADQQVHRVLVTEDDGRLVGIVALADIARQIRSVDDLPACALLARTVASISQVRSQVPVAVAAQ